MEHWLTDPRTIAMLCAAGIQVVVSIWQGRETAKAMMEQRQWRDQTLIPWQADVGERLKALEVQGDQNSGEIERLRNRFEPQ